MTELDKCAGTSLQCCCCFSTETSRGHSRQSFRQRVLKLRYRSVTNFPRADIVVSVRGSHLLDSRSNIIRLCVFLLSYRSIVTIIFCWLTVWRLNGYRTFEVCNSVVVNEKAESRDLNFTRRLGRYVLQPGGIYVPRFNYLYEP